jgi:YHS domain-containing protein
MIPRLRGFRRSAGLALALTVGLVALMPGASTASAPSAQYAFNTDAGGVLLHGYDVMGYFYKNKALPGSNRFSYKWGGGTYWFSSAQYRSWFKSDPDRWVPKYGGWCAMSLTRGKKVDSDPNFFIRRETGLYIFANNEQMQAWLTDEAKHEAEAKARWEQIQFLAPADL